jgi:hypothetical protein
MIQSSKGLGMIADSARRGSQTQFISFSCRGSLGPPRPVDNESLVGYRALFRILAFLRSAGISTEHGS